MVIEDNSSIINSKTKMDQELNRKKKVKVTKSLFSKMKKTGIFSLIESTKVCVAEVDKES